MAKNNDQKPAKKEGYPSFPIDTSWPTEAARRNIGLIGWYKRLIQGTVALLIASSLFTFLSAYFAWSQPLPRVFATSLSGDIFEMRYADRPDLSRMQGVFQKLSAEDESKKALQEREEIRARERAIAEEKARAEALAQEELVRSEAQVVSPAVVEQGSGSAP